MEIAQINTIFHGVFRRGIYRSGDPRRPGGSGPFSGRLRSERTAAAGQTAAETPQNTVNTPGRNRLGRNHA